MKTSPLAPRAADSAARMARVPVRERDISLTLNESALIGDLAAGYRVVCESQTDRFDTVIEKSSRPHPVRGQKVVIHARLVQTG